VWKTTHNFPYEPGIRTECVGAMLSGQGRARTFSTVERQERRRREPREDRRGTAS